MTTQDEPTQQSTLDLEQVAPTNEPLAHYARFKDEQLVLLEQVRKNNPHPNKVKLDELAVELRCRPKKIDTWFSNRRARDRRNERKHQHHDGTPGGSSSSSATGVSGAAVGISGGGRMRKVPKMRCPTCGYMCHVARASCPRCYHAFAKRQNTPHVLSISPTQAQHDARSRSPDPKARRTERRVSPSRAQRLARAALRADDPEAPAAAPKKEARRPAATGSPRPGCQLSSLGDQSAAVDSTGPPDTDSDEDSEDEKIVWEAPAHAVVPRQGADIYKKHPRAGSPLVQSHSSRSLLSQSSPNSHPRRQDLASPSVHRNHTQSSSSSSRSYNTAQTRQTHQTGASPHSASALSDKSHEGDVATFSSSRASAGGHQRAATVGMPLGASTAFSPKRSLDACSSPSRPRRAPPMQPGSAPPCARRKKRAPVPGTRPPRMREIDGSVKLKFLPFSKRKKAGRWRPY